MDKIYLLYFIENKLFKYKLTFISFLIRVFIRIIFSADIPYKAKIGKGTKFPHDALGIVIHPDVKIGNNCCILHGVTIGGRAGRIDVPIIGNNVLIGTHAIISGDVTIGDNATIGAGAIVLKDVPNNAVVVGNPAKIIKYNN